MKWQRPFRVVSQAWRRRKLAQLLDDLQQWEAQGRGLLAQVAELTDERDDLHREVCRVLDLLTDA